MPRKKVVETHYYLKEGQKARNVECIIYPDAVIMPTDEGGQPIGTPWGRIVAYMDNLRVKAALSPLHDEDTYDYDDVQKRRERYVDHHGATEQSVLDEVLPKVGEKKKPHYHLMLCFAGGRTRDGLSQMLAGLVDIPVWRWQVIESVYGATRYLAHMDCKDKPHYNASLVVPFGGFSLAPLADTDDVSSLAVTQEIHKAIADEGIRYYSQLDRWSRRTGDINVMRNVQGRVGYWYRYLSDCSAERAERAERRKAEGA